MAGVRQIDFVSCGRCNGYNSGSRLKNYLHHYRLYRVNSKRWRIDVQFAASQVVSSSFRGLPSIMFRIITDDDQMKDDQATQVVGKGANFIGFGAKLAEEAFQQVS